MDGQVQDAAKDKAREYLRTRGTESTAAAIHDRVGAAFTALDRFLDAVPAHEASRRTIPGEWTVQDIVDHLVETHRPGVDELRCLLAGRRPPGEPIPAGLQSRAPDLRPWPWLRRELAQVHGDILALLAGATDDAPLTARAPLIMVVNVPTPAGGVEPLEWIEELDWKAYAIIWRLHVLDHLNQARHALGATEGPTGRGRGPRAP